MPASICSTTPKAQLRGKSYRYTTVTCFNHHDNNAGHAPDDCHTLSQTHAITTPTNSAPKRLTHSLMETHAAMQPPLAIPNKEAGGTCKAPPRLQRCAVRLNAHSPGRSHPTPDEGDEATRCTPFPPPAPPPKPASGPAPSRTPAPGTARRTDGNTLTTSEKSRNIASNLKTNAVQIHT